MKLEMKVSVKVNMTEPRTLLIDDSGLSGLANNGRRTLSAPIRLEAHDDQTVKKLNFRILKISQSHSANHKNNAFTNNFYM